MTDDKVIRVDPDSEESTWIVKVGEEVAAKLVIVRTNLLQGRDVSIDVHTPEDTDTIEGIAFGGTPKLDGDRIKLSRHDSYKGCTARWLCTWIQEVRK